MLKEFLNKFNFKFIFKSSTENYKNGVFNNSLLRVLEKYEEIMNIILTNFKRGKKKNILSFFTYMSKNRKSFEIPLIRNG
jgi:lysyl-tRNA synthetase class 1